MNSRNKKITGEILGYRYIYIEGYSNNKLTFILFHGMGGSENDLVPIAKAIDPESSILSLRGKIVENGLRRFFRRIRNGVYDVNDLKFRVNEISDFIDIASRKHNFKDRKIIALGYSNGANMATAIVMMRPGVFDGAILMRSLFPLDLGMGDLGKIPILILAGKYDKIAPPGESIDLAERLRKRGAYVELSIIDAGHRISDEDLSKARSWISIFSGRIDRSRIDLEGLDEII
jgi:predicted esterase